MGQNEERKQVQRQPKHLALVIPFCVGIYLARLKKGHKQRKRMKSK
jgi:hypothetical protein